MSMSKIRAAWHYYLLWLIAVLSLVFNVLLLVGIYNFRQRAQREVATAAELMGSIELDNFELPVAIDETLTLSMTVPFSDTFVVPISATIPVSTSVPFQDNIEVPINTVIPVNTRVDVPVPAIGNITLPIPIVTSVPVSMSVDVPISRTIPVQLDIPVNLTVDVPVRSDVPIAADVPVQLEFPVTVPLSEMGFDVVFKQIEAALGSLAQLFGADLPRGEPGGATNP